MGEQQPRWPHTGANWPEWTWQVADNLRQTTINGLRWAQDGKRMADQHGNAEAAQNYAIQIDIYEQITAELDQRDQDAREQYAREHAEWAARERYTSSRNGLWADVLRWARSGELPANWRDLLPAYHARCAAIGGGELDLRDDIDGLALHEFTTLPLQQWEPHATGGDWRASLDAWYRDSLTLHDRTHRQDEKLKASEPQPFRLPQPFTDDASGYSITDEFQQQVFMYEAAKALRDADWNAAKAINHDRRRDRLEAWYRAGLTAGGTGEDWTGWYRDRINTWDRRHDDIYGAALIEADRELARLDDGETTTLDPSPAAAGGWTRIPMQALPDYWQHHAPS